MRGCYERDEPAPPCCCSCSARAVCRLATIPWMRIGKPLTASDIEFLKIYLLLVPVLAVAFAMIIFAMTRWQDAREDRRRAAKDAATHRL